MNENLFEVPRPFRLDANPDSGEPNGCRHIKVT